MRVALIADVHGNRHALEAVLAEAREAGSEAVWMAGDWVGYGAHPEACVELLRAAGAVGVAGDMDREVLRAAAGRFPRRAPAEKREALRHAANALSPSSLAYLAALPARRALAAADALLAHGSPARIDEHLWPDTPGARLAALAEIAGAALVACGHTHTPMDRSVPGVRFVNPGSVGRSADGDPRAAWAELAIERGGTRCTLHRVPYDHGAAASAILDAGLPAAVAQMVRLGRGLREVLAQG